MQRNELSETIGSGDQREKQPLLNASVHPPTQSLTHYHLHTHTHSHSPMVQWRGFSGWLWEEREEGAVGFLFCLAVQKGKACKL